MTTPVPHHQPQQYTFRTEPLTEPVDPHALATFWRSIKAQRPRSAKQRAGSVLVTVVLTLAFLPTIIGSAVATIANITSGGSGFASLFSVMVPVVVAVALIPVLVYSRRRGRETSYRLARFAEANGMEYVPTLANPQLPGMIFQLGHSRVATHLVRGRQPRFVEFGNYAYTTGSGRSKTTHSWGYVAVRLDAPLPNIVLDALGNNALGSNLPSKFSKDQRLSLEGDFDRHFRLYCPSGYEADALYLFTPDIMARFIDHAAQLDVEIVDDWMFLYMRRPASSTDAQTWAWLFGTVGALLTKFDQWSRWRDDRLRPLHDVTAQRPAVPGKTPSPPLPLDRHEAAPLMHPTPGMPAAAPPLPFTPPLGMIRPPGVAPEGRRLRKGFSGVTLAIIAVVFLVMLLPQLIAFLSIAFGR